MTGDILYVIGALEIGGTERHLSAMARALAQRGWRVAVYSLAGDGPLRAELERAGVTVILPTIDRQWIASPLALRALRMAVASVHLTWVMIRRRPGIAHFLLPAAYLVGGVAAALARIKVRVMSRRSLNHYQSGYPLMRPLEILLHRTMTAILGNSQAVVRELRELEHVPTEKLGLIYNGVDMPAANTAAAREAIRATLGLDAETLVLSIVANLIPYKGHSDLIAVLGAAQTEMPHKWHLLVVGRDDGTGAAIAAQMRDLGIAGHVSLLGSRGDVPDLLAASDMGILSSHQEGFSNAVLEAMASGLPMIVTRVGGNAEAVIDGETGLVVPPQNPVEFARAIVRLANDAPLRRRFGDAGRQRVTRLFSQEACVARYEALYRGLLEGAQVTDIEPFKSDF